MSRKAHTKGMTRKPLAVASLLLAVALPAAADTFFSSSELSGSFESMSFGADKQAMCQPMALMNRAYPRGASRGGFSIEDLASAASAVYGEASMNEDEQCAVAAVIFNRARSARSSLRSVVAAPGQFHGYHGVRNRMECEKLEASVAAVANYQRTGRCRFGAPRFMYFCSEAGFQRVSSRHRGDPEQGRLIGMSRFRTGSECGVDSRSR